MLKHFSLILFLLLSTQCITDFWDRQFVTSADLFCLQQKGLLNEAFVRAEFNLNNKQWQVNLDPHRFEAVKVKPHLVLSTSNIEGVLPPLLEARRIFMEFINSPIQKYWISISTFNTSFKPGCAYLRLLASYLKRFSGKEIGFQTEKIFW